MKSIPRRIGGHRQWRLAIAIVAAFAPAAVSNADLRDDVERLIRISGLNSAKIAVSVRDSRTGKAEVGINDFEPMIPASNMKLLTTGAALHVLGPDFNFQTQLHLAGDRLIVIGDGDPGFGDPSLLKLMDGGDRQGIGLEEFLDLWIQPVIDSGIRQLSEIIVDDRVFDRDHTHPDWPRDQLNRRYCAQVAGMNFHLNLVWFYPRPSSGALPDVTVARPNVSWLDVTNRATSRRGAHDRNDAWIARKINTNELTFYGNIKSAYRTPVPVTVHDMPTFFAQLMAERLRAKGVTVGTARLAEPDEQLGVGRPIAPIISTPMTTAITRCNRDSENLYAEALIKRIGHELTSEPGSWMNGGAIIRHVVHERLSDSNLAAQLFVADGSGLSRENRVAAATMTAWLDTFDDDPELGPAFMGSLAQPGTGTLRRRFSSIDLSGAEVRAKSGFINQVSCLSGFVTAVDGRRCAFSIFINELDQSGAVSKAKSLQEKIVAAIAEELASRVVTQVGQ